MWVGGFEFRGADVSMSVCVGVTVCVCRYVSVSVCVSVGVCMCLCVSISVCVRVTVCMYVV